MTIETNNATRSNHSRSRWFRISLRTFFIAFTIVCIFLGWKINAAREQHFAIAAVRALGGATQYDYQVGDLDATMENKQFRENPGWLANILGVDFLHNVVDVQFYLSKDRRISFQTILPQLRRLPRIRYLALAQVDIHDDDFRSLADFGDITRLFIANNEVCGDGFKYLANLKNLQMVDIYSCPVTDQGVEQLAKLQKLETLVLNGTQVNDACIRLFANMPKLHNLSIYEILALQQMASDSCTNCGPICRFHTDSERLTSVDRPAANFASRYGPCEVVHFPS